MIGAVDITGHTPELFDTEETTSGFENTTAGVVGVENAAVQIVIVGIPSDERRRL
jgi:hypothetical protein